MESQQLSQDFTGQYGSACASVTSKEVQTNQDPLDASASQLPESDTDSTKINYSSAAAPETSAAPKAQHHASPHSAEVPFPQNGPYSQCYMMHPNLAKSPDHSQYGHPPVMMFPPYSMSPMYFQSGTPTVFPQYTHPLSTSSSEPNNTQAQRSSVSSVNTAPWNNILPPHTLTKDEDFSTWVKFYIKFLRNSNLGDIIPNDHDKNARSMTHEEHPYLYNTFQTFAPFHLLPTWAKKILEINYADILTILSKSMQKMQTDNQDLQDWMTLAQLEYNGSIPAKTFEITVTTILERLKESDIKVNDKLGCQLILKGLSGEFSCLRQQFRSRRNMKISDLFFEIQSIYEEQKIIKQHKFNKMKISDDYYRTNRAPAPMTDAKIVARTSKKSAPSRHSPRTGKIYNVATSNNSSRVNDPSMDVPSTHSIQLNNNSGLTLRPTKH